MDFKVPEEDLALAMIPGAEFDPKTRVFTAEELKPQPIIKKRKKVRLLFTLCTVQCNFIGRSSFGGRFE